MVPFNGFVHSLRTHRRMQIDAKKNTFYDNLQSVLNDVPHGEEFVLMGDFNAIIGSRTDNDNE